MRKDLCRDEEVSFSRTLQKGLERFNKAKTAASGTLLSGRDAFELYDTFGFPADLTQVRSSVWVHFGPSVCTSVSERVSYLV